jgi:hypothetical protein
MAQVEMKPSVKEIAQIEKFTTKLENLKEKL